MKVLVLGAGVVGTTTALVLARRGLDVTVIERNAEPAAETSFANGGGITPGHAEPWNAPGIGAMLVRWLGRHDAPFRLRPSAIPRMTRWGLSFLANSRPRRFIEHARANTRLAVYSSDCLRALREACDIDYEQRLLGTLKVFYSEADLDRTRELLEQIGNPDVIHRKLTVDATVELEPALAPVAGRIAGALHFPHNESGDAHLFTRLAAGHARAAGARFVMKTPVRTIECDAGGFRRVITDNGDFAADACIVSLGSYSPALLKPLGVRAPIYPVKGYSATIQLGRPEQAPEICLLDAGRRVIVTRLGERILRIAGTAEFGGYDLAIDQRRARAMLDNALRLLPALAPDVERREPQFWTGLRPMTPDGPPLLGSTRHRNLLLNTGHGSLGWTHAAGSAEILADLVEGRDPAIDLSGMDARRYA